MRLILFFSLPLSRAWHTSSQNDGEARSIRSPSQTSDHRIPTARELSQASFASPASQKSTSPLRVAAMFAGLTRTFVDSRVRKSIVQNLLESLCRRRKARQGDNLREAEPMCIPDIFLCPAFEDSTAQCGEAVRKGTLLKEYLLAVDDFRQEIESSRMWRTDDGGHFGDGTWLWAPRVYESPLRGSCRADMVVNCSVGVMSRACQHENLTNFQANLMKLEEMAARRPTTRGHHALLRPLMCFRRQVRLAEQLRGQEYDWVLKLRFDVAFFSAVSPLDSFRSISRDWVPSQLQTNPLEHWDSMVIAGKASEGRNAAGEATKSVQQVAEDTRVDGRHWVAQAPNNHGQVGDHFALVPRYLAEEYFASSDQRCCSWLYQQYFLSNTSQPVTIPFETRPWANVTYGLARKGVASLAESCIGCSELLAPVHEFLREIPIYFSFIPWVIVRDVNLLNGTHKSFAECHRVGRWRSLCESFMPLCNKSHAAAKGIRGCTVEGVWRPERHEKDYEATGRLE